MRCRRFLVTSVLAFGAIVGVAVSCRRPVQAFSSFSNTRWIIFDSNLSSLQKLDPVDANTYFNNALSNIQGNSTPPNTKQIPSGWSSIPEQHYTAYGSCAYATRAGCTSLTDDITAGVITASSIPVIMYDNERWGKTPTAEQQNPCPSMRQFVQLAHKNSFVTIMAPDQNIASPLIGVTNYQGGESQNWQTYLRLGFGSCAASSGTDRYHIMSQPFESHWGPTPEGTHMGGEADFINFVTQASLQARTVNPNLVVTAGLSTNSKYNPTAQSMYQESVDVQNLVDGFWLNGWGNSMGVSYLKLLSGASPTPNSSVLFPHSGNALNHLLPTSATASTLSLATSGSNLTSWTSQTYPEGTVIPAGAWEFQFWTDGSSGSATLGLEFGYCNPSGCTNKVPIITSASGWAAKVTAGARGAAVSGGAFTTKSSTTLPGGGPYRLYWTITVQSAGSFNLLYNSTSAPTNLATPFVQPVGGNAPPSNEVLYQHSGSLIDPSAPAGSTASMADLTADGVNYLWYTNGTSYNGKTVPAGTYTWKYDTDGKSSSTSKLDLRFGYCSGSCSQSSMVCFICTSSWPVTVSGGASGTTVSFSSASAYSVPASGGPYYLYLRANVSSSSSSPLNLLYDSTADPTSLVIPKPQ